MMKFPRTLAAAIAVTVLIVVPSAQSLPGAQPAPQAPAQPLPQQPGQPPLAEEPSSPRQQLTQMQLTQMQLAQQRLAQQQLAQQQVNEEMLKELRAIRLLLEKISTPPGQPPPPPQTARVTNLKGYALGRPDAPLTMVEFTDLQCLFCRQFMLTSFDQIKKNWIDTGKLRYISRDFPLDFHAQAFPAARAARCAGEQDPAKFWELRLGLVRNANLLTPEYIRKTATDLMLDMKPFETCLGSTKFDGEIQAETLEGTALGVSGTPTFVIGRTTPTAVEGPMLVGALPYALFDQKLRALLGPPNTDAK